MCLLGCLKVAGGSGGGEGGFLGGANVAEGRQAGVQERLRGGVVPRGGCS